MRRLISCLLLASAAACRSAGDAQAEADRALVTRAYDAYDEAAAAVDASPDCQSAARALDEVIQRRLPELLAAMAMQADDARMARAGVALDSLTDRYREVAAHMDAAFARCAGVPEFDAAVDRLDAIGGDQN